MNVTPESEESMTHGVCLISYLSSASGSQCVSSQSPFQVFDTQDTSGGTVNNVHGNQILGDYIVNNIFGSNSEHQIMRERMRGAHSAPRPPSAARVSVARSAIEISSVISLLLCSPA